MRALPRMRILTILGILIFAVAGVAVMSTMRPEPPKKERQDLDPLVEVLVLEPMTAKFEISSQGTVKPRTETTLSAEVSGTISEISPKFVAGGVFQAGEVLMRIDPTNYDVALLQAEALVTQRQIEHDGARKLQSQGYRAESEYASAVAALASAKAEQVRAQRNLERTHIRVPYEGIVRSKDTDLGEFVSAGTPLGVVFATDFAEIRLPLTDHDLAYVDLPDPTDIAGSGAAAVGPEVRLSARQKGQDVEWPARIVRTEGVVDEKSRVTYAVARVKDPYQLHGDGVPLPVGTFVTAIVEGTVAENIIQIPRGIIRGTNELVFVDAEDKIDIRNVHIVRSDAKHAYISGGAEPGERVVVTVLESAIDGLKVRTKKAGD
ncbi:MAG: efflux RND transporter periplasmic adaptor subunit [Gammaproteobacteria bacterium]|nr:efflux RND transporter periplasmic adaptor subunit [Gammaproteobacteria bacterium]MDH5239179.1 efflux RND transporter periplasmic adaptor subunit [Gammaproteobacteria bacterium]MDH5261782.1 efflux RND transporter periplasmic adaptor subunit [Gammaproteobacteria bacterium]MDH5582422.1 efflux RND transporter periplasmic adaptor subunit [Gammaproteobacteria bacterium]